MATITTSQVVSDDVQADGSRVVRERHVDSTGRDFLVHYEVLSDYSAPGALAAHAATLLAGEVARETADNIADILNNGSLATVTLLYVTAAQLQTALRDAYRTATRLQAIMIADYLSTLTNAQLQTLFGLTAAQATTFRTNKLTPAATTASAIRAAVGS